MPRFATACGLTALVVLSFHGLAFAETAHETTHETESLGALLPIWSVIPFVGILLSIAFFPLFAPKWWHHHFPKVSAFWATLLALPLIVKYRGEAIHEILHVYIIEYIPFIILLWALFTVAGGIHVKGTLSGSPTLNLILLVIGTVIASWMGTTGASMILIRPVLRANAWRRHKIHVIIFFIFLVSNIGGALTPLGDPPLFLGFLLGVPFFWTMKILPHMLFVAVPLLILFFLIDSFYYRREEKPETTERVAVRVEGAHNLIFLAGVVGAVLFSGMWRPGDVNILGVHEGLQHIVRDLILIVMGFASLATTKKQIRDDNEFTWFPIKEVAILFAGIFMCIVPAISILQAGEHGQLAFIMTTLETPAHYYWITGSLSSFLDNAPSYLTFFNSLLGKFFTGLPHHEGVHGLLTEQATYLKAISAGSVFFGAMTYIGNAPNFMVKSISEEAGVRMPSFFGYPFKYGIPILLPLFLLVTLVFFRI
ncbi:MAG: sodium:proton antiporter [Candidatus Latescibacterota bacterium]|nr:MAG: sodium:proton antiporter [Candidatus Latescibacterota bacterium]